MRDSATNQLEKGSTIAYFASAYYPSVGGVQEVVRQLALRRARSGGNSLIITNRWPKDLPASGIYEGTPVRRYVFRVPENTPKQMGGALLFGPATLASIVAELRRHRVDLINVHCISSNAFYALWAKRVTGLPLVVSLHGELTVDATGLFQRSVFARSLMREVLREADAITACSAKSLAEAEEFYGAPFGRRASVVYSGVDVSEFAGVAGYAHKQPYLLAIGRLERPKGFDVLLEAFRTVLDGGKDVDLLIAGEGGEEVALRARAADLGLDRRVRFLGRADRRLVPQLFAGCLFFVLPSRVEPMGIVNLEAMSAGKAVVASNTGGVSELVRDGETGLLVEPANARQLASAMTRLIDDAPLREKLGRAGRTRANLFDWSVSASKFEEIYEYLIGPASGASLAPLGEM
ncbi:MAG: glycosyltransferase family 4 protein [Capsulimonadaceae bacterium]|nr:glycosyltransferase family 4 protein [Capsulimonadaceae bacterium]